MERKQKITETIDFSGETDGVAGWTRLESEEETLENYAQYLGREQTKNKEKKMKKFVFLYYGYDEPTQEVMEAWGKWFASIGDKMVDSGHSQIGIGGETMRW